MTDDLSHAIASIDGAVSSAERGLPEQVFELISRLTPLVNVDLLVRDEAKRVLLTWRADRFHGPGWHIPGGIVRFKERWEDRIAAVAAAELGTQVECSTHPIAINQPINTTRATRGHFISLLFDCRLAAPLDPARAAQPDRPEAWRPEAGQWAWHIQRPDDLVEVHQRIYGTLLQSLLASTNSEPQP
jgi:colanic acid biosynthesis protein WcaH